VAVLESINASDLHGASARALRSALRRGHQAPASQREPDYCWVERLIDLAGALPIDIKVNGRDHLIRGEGRVNLHKIWA